MNPVLEQLGFVGVDEIQNVFTHELSEIQQDIVCNGFPMDDKIVIEWIDAIRLKLIQRARTNIEEYVRKNPIVKKQEREIKQADLAQSQQLKEGWQDRVKANRAEAIRESLRQT